MDEETRNVEAAPMADRLPRSKATLELCFISAMGIVVLSAFVAALTYDFVAARAPLTVMTPLLILIGAQFVRALTASRAADIRHDLLEVLRGRNGEFNGVAAFIGCMALLLALIFVVGHYVGMAVFMFFLLRIISRESYRLSVSLTAGVTAIIYFLFEHGFGIELYQGLIFRWLSGYGV